MISIDLGEGPAIRPAEDIHGLMRAVGQPNASMLEATHAYHH